MKKTVILLLITICNITNAQNVGLRWAKSVGSSTTDIGKSIVVDASGNSYITGSFKSSADFDPGIGVTNLTSQGDDDIFIMKLNVSGNLVWAKSIGGTGIDYGNSICIDPSGNLYLIGTFQNTVDFDPGVGVSNLTSTGSFGEPFITKLDNLGNLIWAKQFSVSSNGGGANIKVDGSGNVYTCGFFNGIADFDPGAGVSNLTSTGIYGDAFISKLDNLGNYIWARRLGGSGSTNALAIEIDFASNVCITGEFDGTADFDPGASTYTFTAAWGGDTYISKLDASGNFVWAKQMVGNAYAWGGGITTDLSGNIYTIGWYIGTVDYDPGASSFVLSTGGAGGAAFISKLDGAGNFIWAKHFQGKATSGSSSGYGIDLDASNNIYLTGVFRDTVDFDPGIAVYNLLSTNMPAIFVSKLDVSGNFVWAQKMGGAPQGMGQGDNGNSIAIYASDYIYTTGNFQTTSDFDPTAGIYNLTSNGEEDVFIAKLCQNTPPTPTITPSGSTSICPGTNVVLTSSSPTNNVWSTGATTQSISVTATGNYYVTVSNSNGCSAQSSTIPVTVLTAPKFTYSINSMVVSFSNTTSGCSSFLWDFGNGNTSSINSNPVVTYATPGTYNPCLQCTGNLCVSCLTISVPGSGGGGIGITELSVHDSDFLIHPNPNNGRFTIEILNNDFNINNAFVVIYDISNREIKSIKVQNKKQDYYMDEISDGIYYLKLVQDHKCLVTKKIIKQ